MQVELWVQKEADGVLPYPQPPLAADDVNLLKLKMQIDKMQLQAHSDLVLHSTHRTGTFG